MKRKNNVEVRINHIRSEVLAAVFMKIYCDVTPFSLVEVHRRFLRTYCAVLVGWFLDSLAFRP
jgi:hypothetical protein